MPESQCQTAIARSASELVRKNETSPSGHRKRVKRMRRRITTTVKEQRRIARGHGLYAVALTLTYRADAKPCGKDISSFLDKLRSKLRRAGTPLLYVWVLECKRVYHYHLVVWLPRKMRLLTELVARWWPHGHFDVEACRSVYRWSQYMAKSESKQNVPPSLRLFGSGGLDQAGSDAVQFALAPMWLRRVLPVFARPRRCKRGGGWVDVLTGEIYRSPYVWSARGVRRREVPVGGV